MHFIHRYRTCITQHIRTRKSSNSQNQLQCTLKMHIIEHYT